MKSKPSACLSALCQKLETLRALDDRNQTQFAASVATRGRSGITKGQMYLLTEAVFFAAFRAYEQFLRNVFLLYCCGIQPNRRKLVRSHLQPCSVYHAETLVQSAMPFLDWSSPDTVVDRSDAYLEDGYPVKTPLTSNLDRLRELKKIRNHIAHMSKESLDDFKKVVKAHYATMPLKVPCPGEFLLVTSIRVKGQYYLREYMDTMEKVARSMT